MGFGVSAQQEVGKISAEAFARSSVISNYDLSPNGERILYQERTPEGRFYVVSKVTSEGIRPEAQLPIASDIYASGAFWISDSKLFGYAVRYMDSLPRLDEEPAVSAWVMNADGTDRKTLWQEQPNRRKKRKKGRKRKPAHKVSFELLHSLPQEPDQVLLMRVEQTPEKRDDSELDVVSDVFKMNISTGDMIQVTPEHNVTGARMFSWVPDHTGVIRMGYGEVGKEDEPVLLVRKSADSEWTRLHDNDLFKRGKFFPIAFGADPDILYVSSSMATGRSVIYRFSIKRGRLKGKIFGHPSANAGQLFFSKDRSSIAAVSYYDDEFRLDIRDDEFKQRRERIAVAVGDDNIALSGSDDDGMRQIVWVGDERGPGKPWLYFGETDTAIALPEPAPWIDPEAMSSTQSINYRARDGVEIPGYLTLPPGESDASNLPAIVMPHGGPYVRDYKTWDYWVQFLANRGYAVLQPNFRGSSGFGQRFSALGYGEWGDDMQQDVADGAKWLVAQGIADADRICILGGSYGGYAALMGLVQDSDIFRCGVAWAPVTDLKKILVQDNAWDKDYAWYWQVTGGRSKKELKEISPVFQAKKITKPLLLMHGVEDDIVFVDQSRIMVAALEKRRKAAPFRYLEFPGLGHQLETEEARLKFLQEVESFLSEHNPS
ncbi:MAG: S9 family peptidase [Kordiimonadaceae bacterium]|nr:S9 family peptidase [Kordiimonadaceae bacterium]MBO6568706.1 S9 family peptidase [Kordiimonadaceae bacterium]MBO6965318.1 S9 family peptidase [Kordiimonadaceae bacterium]